MAGRRATLCLVHAHPDDESITTGGVILRAKAAGHRVVVVTCTGGEEGEIHNFDPVDARSRLAEIRAGELRRACAILGVDRLVLLGYRDSGMVGSRANRHRDSFRQASLDAAATVVGALLREERPDVVVTYTPDGTYGHPDHVKAHQATAGALRLLQCEGWQPAKAYWHAVPRSLAGAVREELGARSHHAMGEVGVPDGEITTRVDVRRVLDRKRAAVAAHRSQAPADPMTGMTGQVMTAMGSSEHFVRAGGRLPFAGRETDLFDGMLSGPSGLAPGPVPGQPPRRATTGVRRTTRD